MYDFSFDQILINVEVKINTKYLFIVIYLYVN